jgi:hypothetical protein
MNVSAIIVTRGDVDLTQIVDSLPEEWEVVIWDNSVPSVRVPGVCEFTLPSIQDLSVYGRYAAIKHASHDLIFVQDDDCIVSNPQAIVDEWKRWSNGVPEGGKKGGHVVCNMPSEFRHDFYRDHSLVGFGAVFHRDAPFKAFSRRLWVGEDIPWFHRTCDIVFTALTPRVLVDVPKTNLWWAEDSTRMYRQPQHAEERTKMLELVRQVRDA